MYGPPGTGKTMLAKAVAHHTTASFIRVVGSEFVQKYLGEGPRMVRDVFRLAKENSPAIIFIDEIDAIATKRFDAQVRAAMVAWAWLWLVTGNCARFSLVPDMDAIC
jgi:26S proteasome regulatory subunit T3